MKTISGCGSFGRQLFCTVSFLMLAIGIASAQTFINVDPTASASPATDASTTLTATPLKLTDAQLADEWWPPTIITNAAQLAEGFSGPAIFAMPDDSLRWNLWSCDGTPWWMDFSQWPGLQVLTTNQCLGTTLYGVSPRRVTLTLELLTGEIVVRSYCSPVELLRVKPPADYQPGQWPAGSTLAARMWKHWLEAKADPIWEENWGPLEPPTLVLHMELADLVSEKPIRDKNFVAEIVAWEAEQARAATEPGKTLAPAGGGGMRLMMLGSGTCPITNETEPFGVDIATDTNGWMTVTWQSCNDHVYGVDTTEELSFTNTWTTQVSLVGQDGTTSWTDTNAPAYSHRFYRVYRASRDSDSDGDGIPDGWELDNGLNPLDPTDAWQDADGDGRTNLEEYRMGSNPRVADSSWPGGSVTTIRYHYDDEGRLKGTFYGSAGGVVSENQTADNLHVDEALSH